MVGCSEFADSHAEGAGQSRSHQLLARGSEKGCHALLSRFPPKINHVPHALKIFIWLWGGEGGTIFSRKHWCPRGCCRGPRANGPPFQAQTSNKAEQVG